jgi:hypothetical protein
MRAQSPFASVIAPTWRRTCGGGNSERPPCAGGVVIPPKSGLPSHSIQHCSHYTFVLKASERLARPVRGASWSGDQLSRALVAAGPISTARKGQRLSIGRPFCRFSTVEASSSAARSANGLTRSRLLLMSSIVEDRLTRSRALLRRRSLRSRASLCGVHFISGRRLSRLQPGQGIGPRPGLRFGRSACEGLHCDLAPFLSRWPLSL